MQRRHRSLNYRTPWVVAGAVVATVAVGTAMHLTSAPSAKTPDVALAASSRTAHFAADASASVEHTHIARGLILNYSVFRGPIGTSNPSEIAAGYPELQQEFNDMMQPSDPSYHLGLDFGAAVMQQTSVGPELLVPGAQGACVLMQVPSGTQAGHEAAVAACNTAANIVRYGGVGAVYGDPSQGVEIDYGMASNQVTSAQLIGPTGRVATVAMSGNGYAFNVAQVSRLALENARGQTVHSFGMGNAAARKA
jgi:hypothetical protein